MTGRPDDAFDEPIEATSVEGEVVVTGPGHMHGAFSPQAARRSAAALHEASEAAERGMPEEDPDDA